MRVQRVVLILSVWVIALSLGIGRDGIADNLDDDAVWSSIDCGSEEQVELYLKKFPKGLHVEEAHDCLVEIRKPISVAEELPSWAILEAQELLALLGYEPGVADGLWGQRTAKAHAEYLRDMGLPGSEVLTIDALIALRAAAKKPRESAQDDRTVGATFRDCDVCPEMVVVPAGAFLMGSHSSEERRKLYEGPVHPVKIKREFAVGVYEVTFQEWDECLLDGGCSHIPDDKGWGRRTLPVINISWEDAKEFVNWLSLKTGEQYRLLSESEWEYVARAGTTGPFHFGSTISTDQANYDGNGAYGGGQKGIFRERTVPVGSFPSNEFGLHDVHGNAKEWVEDCRHNSYDGAPADGSAWVSGSDCQHRVVRGGSWQNRPSALRSAYRGGRFPMYQHKTIGFRVARTLNP